MNRCALFVFAGIFTFVSGSSYGQIDFHGKYEQNFDALQCPEKLVIPETSTIGTQVPIPEMPGWELSRIGGTENSTIVLVNNDGRLGFGSLFSYGHEGGSDRSLGSQSTRGSSQAFGVSFVNKTGRKIEELRISFIAEIWKDSPKRQDALSFSYGLSGGAITGGNYLSSSDMVIEDKFDVRGPVTGTENTAVDGKADENRIPVEGSLKGLNWKPGQILYLRWSNTDIPGAGAALAIDDFTLEAK